MTRFIAAVVVGLVALTVSASAYAGAGKSYYDTNFCWTYTDGSGYCSGTLRQFRNDPDPNAQVYFELGYFYSYYQGKYGSCWVPSASMTNWQYMMNVLNNADD